MVSWYRRGIVSYKQLFIDGNDVSNIKEILLNTFVKNLVRYLRLKQNVIIS